MIYSWWDSKERLPCPVTSFLPPSEELYHSCASCTHTVSLSHTPHVDSSFSNHSLNFLVLVQQYRLGQCNSSVKSQCQSLFSCKNSVLGIDTISMDILPHCTHFPATPHFCSKIIIDKIMGIFRDQYITGSHLCNSKVVWKICIYPFHLPIHPPLHHKFLFLRTKDQVWCLKFLLTEIIFYTFHLIFLKPNSWSLK